jgi:hypothetical protein
MMLLALLRRAARRALHRWRQRAVTRGVLHYNPARATVRPLYGV